MSTDIKSKAKTQKGSKKKANILVYACNWVEFTGKERTYDPLEDIGKRENVTVVRVMCAARINRPLLIEPFSENIDGIIVLACSPKRCKHEGASDKGKIRFEATKKWLESAGIPNNKLEYHQISEFNIDEIPKIIKNFEKRL